MTIDQILERLKRELQNQMTDYIGNSRLDDKTPLFKGGLALDSLGALALISLTEECFGITYDEADLTEANFKDLHALAQCLSRKLAR